MSCTKCKCFGTLSNLEKKMSCLDSTNSIIIVILKIMTKLWFIFSFPLPSFFLSFFFFAWRGNLSHHPLSYMPVSNLQKISVKYKFQQWTREIIL